MLLRLCRKVTVRDATVQGMDDIEVPGLGTLSKDVHRSYGGAVGGPYHEIVLVSWLAEIDWPSGERVTLTVREDLEPLTPQAIKSAGERALAFREREAQSRREVAERMLDLANLWWASGEDDAEVPLTAHTFLDKIRLSEIVVEDKSFTAYYDDNEVIFAGHALQVEFNANFKLVDTNIPG